MTPWIVVPQMLRSVEYRLICIPYAGAGATIYRDWAAPLSPHVELHAVQPPGRGYRWREPAHECLDELVAELASAIAPVLDRPFALFGHSFGALVAFELTRRLRHSGQPLPQCLFVSGRAAPHLPSPVGPRHDLPKEQFVLELQRLGGTPDEIVRNGDLLDLVLPPIRADFRMLQTWKHHEEPPLAVPIVAFGGSDDSTISVESLQAWDRHSTQPVEVRVFPGDHFFLKDLSAELCSHILSVLELPAGSAR